MVEEHKKPVRLRIVEGDEADAPRPPDGDGPTDPREPELRPIEFSDDALAVELSSELGPDWRCDEGTDSWRTWDGQRFKLQKVTKVYHRSRLTCRAAANRCDNARIARQISSKSVMHAVVKVTATHPKHATPVEAYDRNPWLLNTPGGIVDLHTGKLLSHDRNAMMTRMAAAAPTFINQCGGWSAASCPVFYDFLHAATGGDQQLMGFLQRIAGYCLTGSIEEHAIFFLYGPGGTGKTVFLNVLHALMADYATNAPMDIFTVATGERHPAELAMLHGARLVTASETEEGRRWDEAKLKAITGGDPITGRFMRGNFFTFKPTFKLLMAGNHRPRMRSADDAMRRRFHVIPYRHKPASPDKTLFERLKAEFGGILAWAVAGELERRKIGLAPPRVVAAATDEYFEAEDSLARWVAERCTVEPTATALSRDLFRDFRSWAALVGEFIGSERQFVQRLEQHGFQRWRHPVSGARGFRGIAPLMSQAELGLGGGGGRGVMQHAAGGEEEWRRDPGDDFER